MRDQQNWECSTGPWYRPNIKALDLRNTTCELAFFECVFSMHFRWRLVYCKDRCLHEIFHVENGIGLQGAER
jgi:hypothetical protein